MGTSQPHVEFARRADMSFDASLDSFERALEAALEHLAIHDGTVDLTQPALRGPASTWTYLVDDDPFRNALGLGVAGNLGLAIGAGLLWPLYLLAAAVKRRRGKPASGSAGTPPPGS
jgi:preprotein translocase subunit SecA